MIKTPGTQGYAENLDLFCETVRAFPFEKTCAAFMPFLPNAGTKVLDVGSGAGQNAAFLASRGYQVYAVEPLPDFIASAQNYYSDHTIHWIKDHLPDLRSVLTMKFQFDFILVQAVWHHLPPQDRITALSTLGQLLAPQGNLGISLRNGPAGVGHHVFPTSIKETVQAAKHNKFIVRAQKEKQPAALTNRSNVFWDFLVFQKEPRKKPD